MTKTPLMLPENNLIPIHKKAAQNCDSLPAEAEKLDFLERRCERFNIPFAKVLNLLQNRSRDVCADSIFNAQEIYAYDLTRVSNAFRTLIAEDLQKFGLDITTDLEGQTKVVFASQIQTPKTHLQIVP